MADFPEVTMSTSDKGSVSDGYHTFDELYEHRHALFLAFVSMHAGIFRTWMSKRHDDGSEFEGWFIAGIDLPTGTISYHIPIRLWDDFFAAKATVMETAPKWDGHTSINVIHRLYAYSQQ